MENSAAKIQSMPQKQESNMVLTINGRVIDVWDYETREGKRFGHVFQTVSNVDDPHNMRRSRVVITSDRRITAAGTDAAVKVEISGQVQDRVYTDKNGQKRVFKDFRCYLNEVR